MAQFLSRADIEAAGLDDALDDLNVIRQQTLPSALTTALPSALPSVLPSVLPAAFNTIPFRKGREVNLYELGISGVGEEISTKLNAAIQNADIGTVFLVPPVFGGTLATSWKQDAPIVMRSGIGIRGVAWKRRELSAIWRTGAFKSVICAGTSGGQSSANMIGDIFLERLSLWGNDFDAPIMEMRYASAYLYDLYLGAAGQSAAIQVTAQTQDSLWDRIRIESSGSDDGSVGAIDIYDGDVAGDTSAGHTQNITLSNSFGEAYNGTFLKVYGRKTGLSTGASLLRFDNIKIESPTRSCVPDIDCDRVSSSRFDWRQIVTKGRAASDPRYRTPKEAVFKLTNSQRVQFDAVHLHQTGGPALTRVGDITGSTDCEITLRMADNTAANVQTAPEIILNSGSTGTTGNSVSINSVGSTSKKKLTANQLQTAVRAKQEYRSFESTYIIHNRIDATDAVVNGNLVEALNRADGTTVYRGWNSRGSLAGGSAADISSTPLWELSTTTGEAFVTSLRLTSRTAGPTFTSGTGAPTATAPNGSVYSQTDGTATTTLWVRAAGAWVALS